MKLKILLFIPILSLSLLYGRATAMLIFPKDKIPPVSHPDLLICPYSASTAEPGGNDAGKKMSGKPVNTTHAYRFYALMLQNQLPENHLDIMPSEVGDWTDALRDHVNFNMYVPFCKPGDEWDEKTYINLMVYALQKNDPVGLAWAQAFFKERKGTILAQILCPDREFRPLHEALDMATLSEDIRTWLEKQRVEVNQVGTGTLLPQARSSAKNPNVLKHKNMYVTPSRAIIVVGLSAAAGIVIKKLYNSYSDDEKVSDSTVDEQELLGGTA